jgi:hypothetical protein
LRTHVSCCRSSLCARKITLAQFASARRVSFQILRGTRSDHVPTVLLVRTSSKTHMASGSPHPTPRHVTLRLPLFAVELIATEVCKTLPRDARGYPKRRRSRQLLCRRLPSPYVTLRSVTNTITRVIFVQVKVAHVTV